jgi:hypothetical protein
LFRFNFKSINSCINTGDEKKYDSIDKYPGGDKKDTIVASRVGMCGTGTKKIIFYRDRDWGQKKNFTGTRTGTNA